MDEGKKDFKAVKVSVKGGTKNKETISRSMMYSGVNIFGELSRAYMEKKRGEQELETVAAPSSFARSDARAAGAGSASLAGESSAEDAMRLQNEELLVFKKITKKDPITKCKALK